MVVGSLLAALSVTACGSTTTGNDAVEIPSPAASAELRTLSPEGSGPVATITPTPVTSPTLTSQTPVPTPTPSASPSAAAANDNKSGAIGAVPKPKETKKQRPAPDCDPNYAGACVPIVAWDLDCVDIGDSVTVIGTDIHRFDADGDGAGCESY